MRILSISDSQYSSERVSYDGGPEETVQHINYNAIGQVESNLLGWFTENCGYNFRGALTSKSSPVFSQTVSFEGLNNGSIAKITDTLDGLTSTNVYDYDAAGRLSGADIKVGGNDRSTAYGYDANSNITYLMRWGADGTKAANMVDELYYEYDGNRVRNIYDCCGAAIHEQSMDFADGADDDIEYTYDANGNTLTDSNKGVSYKWDYNNMLACVNYGYGGFGMNDYMQFTRTASGRMMARQYAKVKTPSLFPRAAALNPRPSTTIGGTFDKPIDSIGGTIGKPIDINRFYEFTLHDRYGHYEFTDGRLTRINTSTGYRDSLGTHIYVRDWQGNVRAVVSRDGGSTVFDQTTYYYPYGLPMAESTSPQTNPYKYTAKELLTDQALNLADHGARMYDPAMARWLSEDNLQEKYMDLSSYNFTLNNPINYIDYDGNDASVNVNGNDVTIKVNIFIYGENASTEIAQIMQQNILSYWGVNPETNTNWTYTDSESNQTYTIRFDVNVELYDSNNPTKAPGLFSNRFNPFNRDNFIEISDINRSFVSGGDEGTWRSCGRNGMDLKNDDSSPHEFGHLLGFKDRYTTNIGPHKGWKNNIMAEPTMKGRVEQRNINALMKPLIKEIRKNKNKNFNTSINYMKMRY